MSQDRTTGAISGPSPVERVRGSRPDDETWRADALAGSRHSRWIDELRQPLEVHDKQRAEEICGEITRLALQDFAPALLLLSSDDRRRVQAITAYALTLFDFARQSGMEGERLTAINRWEFELESTLDGRPVGQPVFVLIYLLEQQRPWAREGFDALHAIARRRSTRHRPQDRMTAESDAEALGTSLAWLLLGAEPPTSITELAAVLVRLQGLQHLGDDIRRRRARLPISEISDSWSMDAVDDPEKLGAVIDAECQRLTEIQINPDSVPRFPRDQRAAARYCIRAARRLILRIRSAGVAVLESAPQLGLPYRIGLLLRSRWF